MNKYSYNAAEDRKHSYETLASPCSEISTRSSENLETVSEQELLPNLDKSDLQTTDSCCKRWGDFFRQNPSLAVALLGTKVAFTGSAMTLGKDSGLRTAGMVVVIVGAVIAFGGIFKHLLNTSVPDRRGRQVVPAPASKG